MDLRSRGWMLISFSSLLIHVAMNDKLVLQKMFLGKFDFAVSIPLICDAVTTVYEIFFVFVRLYRSTVVYFLFSLEWED